MNDKSIKESQGDSSEHFRRSALFLPLLVTESSKWVEEAKAVAD